MTHSHAQHPHAYSDAHPKFRGLRGLAVLALTVWLAGCASSPPSSMDPPASGGTVVKEDKPAPSTRGGGYYLDDGPGDDAPSNIDQIPDAVPRSEPLSRFANKPYVAMGQEFVPISARKPFKQRGVASWYGRRFHNKKTASGEPYDMYAMTAAHPVLPIPSYAKVTNVANGKSVIVRINDRGPFLHNRIVDLSYAAASKLGFVHKGSALVELEAITDDQVPVAAAKEADASPTRSTSTAPVANDAVSNAPPLVAGPVITAGAQPARAAPAPQNDRIVQPNAEALHYVQVGAFSAAANAEGLKSKLARDLGARLDRTIEVVSQQGLYRVRIGPYATPQEAHAFSDELGRISGMTSYVVR